MRVAALFVGIAGLELGLEQSGHETLMFCEFDPGAQAVLKHHFLEVPLVSNVRTLKSLHRDTELVTAKGKGY
jgi:DNA (cytosine-5)-methyltransferase 1